MSGSQILIGIVAHPDGLRQQERVGNIQLIETLAPLPFGALLPVVDHGPALKDPLKFRVINKFADEPATIRGESREVEVFTGEQFFMVHVVPELGLLKLPLKSRRTVFGQLPGKKIEKNLSLLLIRLVLLLWRHVTEVDLLLHSIQKIQALGILQRRQIFQANITLLGLVVAVVTIILKKASHRSLNLKSMTGAGQGSREKGQDNHANGKQEPAKTDIRQRFLNLVPANRHSQNTPNDQSPYQHNAKKGHLSKTPAGVT